MKYFTAAQLISAVPLAILYGALFYLSVTLLRSFCSLALSVLFLPKHVFAYTRLKEKPILNARKKEGIAISGEISAGLKTVLFAFGFILLSYYTLDGSIRLYMLLFSLFGLLIFRGAVQKLMPVICRLAFAVYYFVTVLLRLIFLPLKRIYVIICNFLGKKIYKNSFIVKKRSVQHLDKHINR